MLLKENVNMNLNNFLLINLGALVTAVGGIFLKKMSRVDISGIGSLFTIFLSWNFWLAGICYVFPIFLWWYLLQTMDLTKLQPMLSIVYLYTMLLSFFFLGEHLSLHRILGIFIVMVGVIIVGRS